MPPSTTQLKRKVTPMVLGKFLNDNELFSERVAFHPAPPPWQVVLGCSRIGKSMVSFHII